MSKDPFDTKDDDKRQETVREDILRSFGPSAAVAASMVAGGILGPQLGRFLQSGKMRRAETAAWKRLKEGTNTSSDDAILNRSVRRMNVAIPVGMGVGGGAAVSATWPKNKPKSRYEK